SAAYKAQRATSAAAASASGANTLLAKAQVLSSAVLRPVTRTAAQQTGKATQQISRPAQESAKQTGKATPDTKSQVPRGAKRRTHHVRWFRRGLLLGGVAALLYAPQPGAQLRARLTGALDRWTSRIA